MADKIFREGMQIPQDIDTISAPPKGFKPFRDLSGKDPVEWAKTVITANFPAVTNIQVFHEAKTDIGGKMVARFFYNRKSIELPITNQQALNTLTPAENQALAPHIQRMSPIERGVFNSMLQHMKTLDKKHASIQGSIHAAIDSQVFTA